MITHQIEQLIADFQEKDAQLIARQRQATTDAERLEIARARHAIEALLETDLMIEDTNDLIEQIERQDTGASRAA